MEPRPDLVGAVLSMSAVVTRGGSEHPQFAFIIVDGTVHRTLYVNLAKEGSDAIVTIVNAAYLLRKSLLIGLSGALPGDVAWVHLSKPRPAAAA
jgi:hypothetical protein